jgi:hypothetical protein
MKPIKDGGGAACAGLPRAHLLAFRQQCHSVSKIQMNCQALCCSQQPTAKVWRRDEHLQRAGNLPAPCHGL